VSRTETFTGDAMLKKLEAVSEFEITITNPKHFEVFYFEEDRFIPNSHLPVIFYESVLTYEVLPANKHLPEKVLVDAMNVHLREQGWNAEWAAKIYKSEHYHSTAHEMLGVIGGSATLVLGGVRSKRYATVDLYEGDVVLIPAGVAHTCVSHSERFLVVGAYPENQKYDMCWGTKKDLAKARRNIPKVELPSNDPLFGVSRIFQALWR
jgi:uncharacterized protein YjlB